MSILVTGAAGFIGFHVCQALLDAGEAVVGIDNLNDYYDPSLKEARLELLTARDGFDFHRLDIAERDDMMALAARHESIDRIVHLAAQAGVRYSLENPHAYLRSNIDGQLNVLEMCRRLPDLKHFVFASSSSVYGANKDLPFAVEDRVDDPISLYAATKRSGELIGNSYGRLYGIPMTGLRFFTVYGPWGRPDMAAFIFTRKILAGEPIQVFNHGDMRRDFTYIDDIVAGVLACLEKAPRAGDGAPPVRLYNLGNHRSEPLTDLIALIEQELGMAAEVELLPMQPGDVQETYADIETARTDLGFSPSTNIAEGIPRFIKWYREYYGV